MAKLPFGGIDLSEPAIDPRADPRPLLDEIAKCAEDHVPMRPALARWFWDAWKADRISVKRIRGARPKDDSDRLAQALLLVDQYEREGHGTEEAINRVRTELSLKSSRETIYKWRAGLQKTADAERTALASWQEEIAVGAFQRLANEGIVGTNALAKVRQLFSEPDIPTTKALQGWQWIAEHSPPGSAKRKA